MPLYNYICDDCLAYAKKKLGRELTDDDRRTFLFEARHSMTASPAEIHDATECPFCDGHNTKRTLLDVSVHTFIRGHIWEEFKRDNTAAMRRDMALHQLQNDDPYAGMREPGEADDLANRLKMGGKKDPGRQYFVGPGHSSSDEK